MSAQFIGMRVNDSGEIILPLHDAAGREAFFKEFFRTPVGKAFAQHRNERSEARIEEVVEQFYGPNAELTIPMLTKVISTLLDVRDPDIVTPEEPETEAVVDSRPRNAQGQFLSEFEIWASDPHRSMQEVRSRANRESAFREWFHKATVEQTFQDGGLRIIGAPARTASDADRAVLGEFARLYRVTPSARLKPIAGIITIDETHRYKVTEFNELVEQAARVGLL